MKRKEVTSIVLDPMKETADVDESNNIWGKEMPPSKFELYKMKKESTRYGSQSYEGSPEKVSEFNKVKKGVSPFFFYISEFQLFR